MPESDKLYNVEMSDHGANIIGNGLLAYSLKKQMQKFNNICIFASGVSDSTCIDVAKYEREHELLYTFLEKCLNEKKKIVYFSSGGTIYGANCTINKESSPLFPKTMYGKHKLLCESLIKNSGVNYVILRLSNVIGFSKNKKQLIPSLVEQAFSGYATIYRNAYRDLIDVEDVVFILIELLKVLKDNEIINVASGKSYPVVRIFNEVQSFLGTNAEIQFVRGGDKQQFSIVKLKKILPHLCFDSKYPLSIIGKYIGNR